MFGPDGTQYYESLLGGEHMSIEELKAEALRLSPEARAHLARELLASLDTLNEAEIEQLWLDEAIRRDGELDKGEASAFPADEVIARMRKGT
jgi:hypothetical protein